MKKFLVILIILLLSITSVIFSQIATEWIKSFNGPAGGYDYLRGMTVDDSGNVYVTGNATKCATIKYSSTGVMQWVRYYESPDSNEDRSHAITLDKAKNVIIAGECNRQGFGFIPTVVKYNNNGEEKWAKQFLIRCSYANALFINSDHESNIYIVGTSYNSQNDGDYFVLKLDSNGVQQWINIFDIEGNNNYVNASVLDKNGNIYITGTNSETTSDFLTVKMNSDGLLLWHRIYDGGSVDVPVAMTIDNNNNVVVVGSSHEPNGVTSFLTIKYDSSGTTFWIKEFEAESSDNYPSSITCDSDDNYYITGTCLKNGWNILTIKIDSSGLNSWSNLFQPPNSNICKGQFITVDNGNRVWVCGSSGYISIPGSVFDFITIEYNKFGQIERFAKYNGTGNGNDKVTAMILDKFGNVFVSGTSYNAGSFDDYVLIKYNPFITEVENINTAIPDNFRLFQNYPNPFNPSTTIQYAISSRQFVTLKVYDVLGKEVATLINEEKPSGIYNVQFTMNNLSSGIYYYQLRAGDFVETKKMILLR